MTTNVFTTEMYMIFMIFYSFKILRDLKSQF